MSEAHIPATMVADVRHALCAAPRLMQSSAEGPGVTMMASTTEMQISHAFMNIGRDEEAERRS